MMGSKNLKTKIIFRSWPSLASFLSWLVSPGFLLLNTGSAVVLRQEVGELLVGRLGEDGLLPEVGGKVAVGLGDGGVGCLGKVSKSSSGALGGGVAILNSSHLEKLLGDGSGDDASSTGSGDESNPNAAALSSHLTGHRVRLAQLSSPEAAPHGHNGELGHDDGAADGGGDLLAALHAEPDVAVVVADGHEGLESGSLSSPGLLLDRHDLENLVLEGRSQEEVNDLVLLDGEGEEVDLLQGLDLAVLHQAAKLGHRDPFLLLLSPATAPAAVSTAPAPVAAASASPASVSESSTEATTITGWSCVRHV